MARKGIVWTGAILLLVSFITLNSFLTVIALIVLAFAGMRYKCGYCGLKFNSKYPWERHEYETHEK